MRCPPYEGLWKSCDIFKDPPEFVPIDPTPIYDVITLGLLALLFVATVFLGWLIYRQTD